MKYSNKTILHNLQLQPQPPPSYKIPYFWNHININFSFYFIKNQKLWLALWIKKKHKTYAGLCLCFCCSSPNNKLFMILFVMFHSWFDSDVLFYQLNSIKHKTRKKCHHHKIIGNKQKIIKFYTNIITIISHHQCCCLNEILQTGRSDSYRVATVPSVEDDNLTADGQYKVRMLIGN